MYRSPLKRELKFLLVAEFTRIQIPATILNSGEFSYTESRTERRRINPVPVAGNSQVAQTF
jgi:hypothetical protein